MRLLSCTLAAWVVIVAGTAAVAQQEKYLGPCALAASSDGKTLYVANADGRQVAVVELAEQRVTAALAVPSEPTGLTLRPDEKRLYVTCAAPRSTVLVIDLSSRRTIAAIPVGHTAMSPVITPDGKRLYVCNRFDNDVSIIDVERVPLLRRSSASPQGSTACEQAVAHNIGGPHGHVRMVREPVAAAVTPDGKTLVVVNHLSADRAGAFFSTPIVTLLDTRTQRTTSVRLPDGATGVRGVCISPEGKHAYVTHTLANYQLVPSQVSYGWMNTNSLSVVDLTKKERLNTVQLDECWRTAPYLHDGRYATLKEVFTTGNHGHVEKLDQQQIDDLVEFMLSL